MTTTENSGRPAGSVWLAAAEREPGEMADSGERGPSPRQRFVRRFRRQRIVVAATVFVAFLAVIAVLAPWLAPADPNEQDLYGTLLAPGAEDYPLGTDTFGRDVFSRLIFGARISLLAAVQAVAVALALGVPPGLAAGYLGGRVDRWIMRASDAVMAFPPLILAAAIVGARGPGLGNAMFAVGVVFAPRFLRLVRASVLGVREETYIEAAHSIGTPHWRIVRVHVFPNILSPLIIATSLAAGFAMLSEAALSFLGLGVQPPDASWGSMLKEGFSVMETAPWLVVFPGIVIALTVLSCNIIGDGIRDSVGRETRSS